MAAVLIGPHHQNKQTKRAEEIKAEYYEVNTFAAILFY